MKVLLVDDDSLIRESLSIILGMEEDIVVCATASNGQEAVELCRLHQPDLVLMDIRMPVLDGVESTRHIKERFPGVDVVMLTTFQDDEYILQAVKYGAAGYILKNQPSDNITNTLRAVFKGNSVFQKDIAVRLNTMLKTNSPTSNEVDLTGRELEILALLGQGKSNKEIANELFLSEGTVRNYISALLEKLELRDRTQLAIFYLKNIE